MDKKNECRFSRTPITIMFLISCLILMGCNCNNSYVYVDWSDKDSDFLITQLKTNPHPDYYQRHQAVFLLAEKTQERDKVIPALTYALLNDEYQLIRVTAAKSLVKMEPPAVSAIPALITALQSEDRGRQLDFLVSDPPDYNLHEVVIELLGEMGSDATEAIPALLEVFRSNKPYFWGDAGLAIYKIDPSMLDIVKEGLIEKRALSTLAELAELAEMDEASLVPVYIKVLSEPGSGKRKIAINALKEIAPAAAKGAAAYVE